MNSLDIQASKPYQVLIDTFLLERAGEIARSLNAGRRALIISDTNVAPLYAEPVKSGLQAAGYTCELAVFSAVKSTSARRHTSASSRRPRPLS